MKKQVVLSTLFSVLMSMVGTKAFSYDFTVKNTDGVIFYFSYINDGTELEFSNSGNGFGGNYSGSIVIPEEVTYMNRTRKVTRIGNGAFANCYDLKSVTIPNTVKSIGYHSFGHCYELRSIIIPNSVTSIEKQAFEWCGLNSITIPGGVTNIEEGVFNNTSPKSIKVSVTDYSAFCNNIVLKYLALNSLVYYIVTKGPNFSVILIDSDGNEISDYNILDDVTSIGNYAFAFCRLTSITIPNSVTKLNNCAFAYCSGLTSVIIPNSVKSIGEQTFMFCSGLTSITIGKNVKSIGSEAFSGCSLSEVFSGINTPFAIDANTFTNDTYYNSTLYVPTGTIDKYKTQDGWKKFSFIEEDSTLGIIGIIRKEENEIKRYTLDGRVVKDSHKGLNIIQTNKKTAQKVIVK